MSLYEIMFGDGKRGWPLLSALGFEKVTDVGRYRTAWLERDAVSPVGDDGIVNCRIAVYTRNGGGNREEYAQVFATLATHPCYLFDIDDEFDATYATIYFSMPEVLVDQLDTLTPEWRDRLQDAVDTSARWKKAIAALETDPGGG